MKLKTPAMIMIGAAVFSLIILINPGSAAMPLTEATSVCSDCEQQCWQDANTGTQNEEFWKCVDAGNSRDYCEVTVTNRYYNTCVSHCNYIFGCNIEPLPSRPCRQGPCQ